MNSESSSQGDTKARHYIIVVHGIGEQKINETTTPVVHRFAEERQGKKKGHYKNLIPAYLSAQSVQQSGQGHGWSEFNGIPIDENDPTGPFDGTPATENSGRNFRFVDLSWQHILDRHQKEYASPVEQWAPALLARLKDPKITPQSWLSPWAFPLLESFVNVVLPIKNMLGFKNQDLTKKIFDNILGDVHLYGDYSRTRGRAVRHFHTVLDEIMLRDFIDWCYRDKERIKGDVNKLSPYQPPAFTIMAHSLGSMMSFDALVYANAKKEVREKQGAAWDPCPSLPFLGYAGLSEKDPQLEAEGTSWKYLKQELEVLKENGDIDKYLDKYLENYKRDFPQGIKNVRIEKSTPKIPPLNWQGQIKNFITLGSPIDKYHVLWWPKYLHMGLKRNGKYPPGDFDWEKGVGGWLDTSIQPIYHYNFCDEQDPVGHQLDVARGTVNYEKIFKEDPKSLRDIVFQRYAKPGVAHVMYWEDKELFGLLINNIISRKEDSNLSPFHDPGFKHGKQAFRQALLWAYFRVPFFAAFLTGILILYVLFGETPIYQLGAGIGVFLLWVQFTPLKAYKDEANPEDFDKEDEKGWIAKGKIGKFRAQRGIFARLVAGMIEWRRIVLMLRPEDPPIEDKATQKVSLEPADTSGGSLCQKLKKIFFEKAEPLGWSFWWRWGWRTGLVSILLCFVSYWTIPYVSKQVPNSDWGVFQTLWMKPGAFDFLGQAGIGAIILFLTYLMVMGYVAGQFVKAKYKKA